MDKVSPEFLSQWLLTLTVLVGLVIGVLKIVEMIKGGSPARSIAGQPIRIKHDEDLATRTEVNSLATRLEGDIEELREAIMEDRKVARDALGKVHHRIDVLAENTSEMKGTMKGMDGTLKLLLERVTNR